MVCKTLHFSGHATVQMFKRKISVNDIENILLNGRIIKSYPEDKPFPSYLVLGVVKERVLHIVVSSNIQEDCYIITAYEPDSAIWNEDFSSKK